MKNKYLNDFHRQRSERLEEKLSKQPKVSLEDALEQYDRIKRGSKRQEEELRSVGPAMRLHLVLLC